MLTIGSLFSGIGGLELGLEMAGLGPTLWQVEREQFPRAVLAKHWPAAQRFDDVLTVGAHNLAPVDIICGGFPCQDLSYAGKGSGLDGDRSGLWWEFHRIICEMVPRFVVIENVPALLARGFDAVLGSLASSGYDAEWDCIPAASVGAPHARDRIFMVAYPNGKLGAERRRVLVEAWDGALRKRDDREHNQGFGGMAAAQAASSVCRVGDGIPNRVDRVRACGNAVVPQVAEVVGRLVVELARTSAVKAKGDT